MPELPEVERARKVVEAVTAGRTIERAWCDDDRIVFAGVTPKRVARHLKGRRVEAVRRRGKQMWVELDARPWLLLHLGMTGQLVTPSSGPIRLASSARELDDDYPPRFAKLQLWLSGGAELVFTNARRLGRIRLLEDPEHESPIAKLGFDPLYEMPAAKEFAAALRRRKGVLKAVLLDQSFAAGVGNWIADEVLYQARIDPRRRGTELDEAEARRIGKVLQRVIHKACAVDADKSRFPRGWLFHRRWGKQADAKSVEGHAIAHIELGGRTTAWVPAVQR